MKGPIALQLQTMVSLSNTMPFVVVQVIDTKTEKPIAPMQLTTQESREIGMWFLEAAEAAEQDAHLIIVMRSHKVSENVIGSIIREIREMRPKTRLEKTDAPT